MRLFLYSLLMLVASASSAQIYLSGQIFGKDSCDFSSDCSIIQFDSSIDNTWTIGKPHKTLFTEGVNDSMCLFTDTSIYYKENVSSSFEIFAPNYPNSNFSYLDGNALLSFWHKLNTDTLKDGGFIEISNDNGINWVNVLNDSSNIECMQSSPFGRNMYNRNQKLCTNEPGFSGTISEWTLCEIPLIRFIPVFTKSSTRIRFTFISDSIPSLKEGWMIDNVKLSDVSLPGGLNTLNRSPHTLSIYPNPCSDNITITSLQENFNGTLSILNMEGKTLRKITPEETKSIQVGVSDLQEGVYTLLYQNRAKGDFYFKLVK